MMNTTLERGQTTTARDQVSRNWSQWQPPQQNGKQTQNENDIMAVITHHSSYHPICCLSSTMVTSHLSSIVVGNRKIQCSGCIIQQGDKKARNSLSSRA